MGGIFVSYRREDAAGWALGLVRDLRRELPAIDVFHDIGSIELGEDFVDAMRRSLGSCAVAVVLIGPRWLDVKDEAGRRRLDDAEDHVRFEVEESLRREGLRVMPVLVGGAAMPKAPDLPEPMRPLARRNAHEITDKRWDYDVGQLVAALKKVLLPATHGTSPAGSLAGPMVRPSESRGPGPVERRTVEAFRDAPDAPEMVVVPAGELLMGSPDGSGRPDEHPQHKVTIARPFAVGKYAATFDEWDAYVAAVGRAHRPEDEGWGRGRWPAINVSWEDAQGYAAWLSVRTGKPYRLLSEAEWEYSARAGTSTAYPWGDEPGTNRANFRGSGCKWSGKSTAPVGSFEPNAFGLHEMIGNVWECVQDCWNAHYAGAPSDGLAWEKGECGRRVVRGGSWFYVPDIARSALRLSVLAGERTNYVGFRLARRL